jgi:hypothetical protein
MITVSRTTFTRETVVFSGRRSVGGLLPRGSYVLDASHPSVTIPVEDVINDPILSGQLSKMYTLGKIVVLDDTGEPVDPAKLPPYPVVTTATRPDPSTVPAGYTVWNADDNALNLSDGTNWRDTAGNLT